MTTQVKLSPGGRTFDVDGQESVLEAALRHGINLPYGCRNGACGACKATILEGEVSHRPYQEKSLTPAEVAQGVSLLCCAEPTSETLVLDVKEVGGIGEIPIKTLPCRVESLTKVHDVAVLKLKIPVSERLQFLAGQYIDILMRDGKARSFSLANPPHDDSALELHIRHMPGGSFSDYVFSQMKEKEILRFKGPLGSFFLQEESTKPIILLASGTGFAPIKAIIEHALHVGIRRPMTLYWGARRPSDLYMDELPQKWVAEHGDFFSYVPVVSDALPEDGWTGRTGFVHQAVLDDFADLSGYEVYACGAPVVVEAAHTHFIAERQLPKDAFFSDAFFLSKDATVPAAKP